MGYLFIQKEKYPMITEKTTIKCEAVFNEDHTHRFLWKWNWEKSKPIATVIMLDPCESDSMDPLTPVLEIVATSNRMHLPR